MADIIRDQSRGVPNDMLTRYKDMGDTTHAEVVVVVGGGTLTTTPSTTLAEEVDCNAPAANTAAVVTYDAIAGQGHVLSGVAWSYNDDPTGGELYVTVGGAMIFAVDVTTGGPGFIPFDPPKRGDRGANLVITLTAGGAAVKGKVNACGHWTE